MSHVMLVQEGIALAASNYSPYSGDIYHEVNYILYTLHYTVCVCVCVTVTSCVECISMSD